MIQSEIMLLLPYELWFDVPGYEGEFMFSSMGHVKSLNYNHTGKPQVMTPDMSTRYARYPLKREGKTDRLTIHLLIAELFVPNPDGKPFVDHIDTDRTNNSISNLRWVTAKENSNNPLTKEHLSGVNNGMYGVHRFGNESPNKKPVLQYTKDGQFIREWEYAKLAADTLHINRGSIASCCNGLLKSAGGFVWKHKKNGG